MSELLKTYQITGAIGQSERYKLFKAIDLESNKIVALKMVASGNSSAVASLRNEYNNLQIVSFPGIRKTVRLSKIEDFTVLALEYIPGFTLSDDEFLNLPIERKLKSIIQLIDSLEVLRESNILHLDISPSNLIYNEIDSSISIIDFDSSIVTATNKYWAELPSVVNVNYGYISPELTGRINRKIDLRSDIYSLGMVLYHAFSAVPPFEKLDPIALVYSQVALTPKPPHLVDDTIPVELSSIVMKMIQKAPEDRYQSWSGLKRDLQIIANGIETNQIPNDFIPGNFDSRSAFQTPGLIFGRKSEVELLNLKLHETISGKSQCVFISGPKGVGKTSLVKELLHPISEKKLHFSIGTINYFSGKTPYQVIINALENLFQWYLTLEESTVKSICERIKELNGSNLGLITKLVPSASILLGKQEEVEQLSVEKTANRLSLAFKQFIGSLSSPDRPLVLFLDDLEFADNLSLDLIESIMEDADMHFVLLIGSYNSTVNPNSESKLDRINRIKSKNAFVTSIELDNLPAESVYEFVNSSFQNLKVENAEILSEVLYRNSQGNPALLLELMQYIQNNDLISYDYDVQDWDFNIDEIKSFKVSTNFFDVLQSRINQLSEDDKLVLSHAAIIGYEFSFRTLLKLTQRSEADVQQTIDNGIREYIIHPTQININFKNSLVEDTDKWYAFSHEEFLTILSPVIAEEKQIVLHWETANILLSEFSQNQEYFVTEIAQHLNFSDNNALNQEQKAQKVQYNLKAGKRIKEASGWELALEYFKSADQILLNENQILDLQELTEFLYHSAECSYLTGQLEEANKYINRLELLANSPIAKARINGLKLSLQINRGDFGQAKIAGFNALKDLGISPPGSLVALEVAWLILKLHFKLRKKNADYFLNLPRMEDGNGLLAGAIIETIQPVLYNDKFELLVNIQLKYFELILKKGNSPYSQLGYSLWGTLQSLLFKNYARGWELNQIGSEIVKSYNSAFINGRNEFTLGFVALFSQDIHTAIGHFEKSYHMTLKSGDFLTTAHVSISLITDKFFASLELNKLISDSKQYLDFSKSFNYSDSVLFHSIFIEFMEFFSNPENTIDPALLFDSYRHEIQHTKYTNIRAVSNLYKAIAFAYSGQVYKAVPYLSATKKEVFSLTATAHFSLYHFFSAVILWKTNDWQKYRGNIRKHLKALKGLELGGSNNTTHFLLTIEAIVLYENKKIFQCIKLLKEAQQHAERANRFRDIGLISEILGDIFVKEGLESWASSHYLKSSIAYEEWGCIWKHKQLQAKTGISEFKRKTESNLVNSSSANIDLLTTIKLSAAISGEVQLQPMASNLLSILIENAGAEYGCIFLNKVEKPIPYVEGEVQGGEIKIAFVNDAITRIPMSFVRYALRSGETIVLDDATSSPLFTAPSSEDQKRKIGSVFCHPVISKGNIIAVIYLENNHLNGAFSADRIKFMELLSGQISISLENSILYENLEQKVEERTLEITKKKEELEIQKKKSDDLLLNILPEDVAEELKQTGKAAARLHPEATVMFMDIISFTNHAETIPPDKLVAALDDFFGRIDKIIWDAGIEKIKTIGDAYLCASGLPIPDENHAEKMIKAALKIIESQKEFNNDRIQAGEQPFQFRIGIHSGPVVSGVVGTRKFAYDIWGDTVNTSARMESQSQEGKINISGTTYGLIKDKFHCTSRGALEAKNKGLIPMYFVEGEK